MSCPAGLLQANDGHSATKSFDVVASQGLPVAFLRRNARQQAGPSGKGRVESGWTAVDLSFVVRQEREYRASQQAGRRRRPGGDMVIGPTETRQQGFAALDVSLSDIKRVETDKGLIKLKLTKQEITLAPIYLPSFTPIEGPQARQVSRTAIRGYSYDIRAWRTRSSEPKA